MQKEDIARICHEVNRALCIGTGDDSQPEWNDAPDWQKESALNGVEFHLTGERQAHESHANWLKQKESEGWVYGEVKDPVNKTHPCCVPFEQLSPVQQAKDYVFKQVVDSLKPFLNK